MATGGEYPLIEFRDIEKQERIGSGSFGIVYKSFWKNQLVAVKEFESNRGKRELEKEVTPLLRIQSHPNIIGFYGAAMEGHWAYLVMEYADCGNLHRYIHFSPRQNYTKNRAISLARQCAEGVNYLHEKNFVHRDLKPGNLLLLNNYQVLKICDFGTVVELKSKMTTNRGTTRWMAPEVFKGNNYTQQCDVYSWSIILWELFSRQIPFENIQNEYVVQNVVREGKRPEPVSLCPIEIREIMVSCWDNDPGNRHSMREIVQKMSNLSFTDGNSFVTGINTGTEYDSTRTTDISTLVQSPWETTQQNLLNDQTRQPAATPTKIVFGATSKPPSVIFPGHILYK